MSEGEGHRMSVVSGGGQEGGEGSRKHSTTSGGRHSEDGGEGSRKHSTADHQAEDGSGGEGPGPRKQSGASGGEGPGSRKQSGASGGGGGVAEGRTSVGSAGGTRVSFGEEQQGARGSSGAPQPGNAPYQEYQGEGMPYYEQEAPPQELSEHEPDCSCSECECPEEEEKPVQKSVAVEEPGETYQLDEFMRAKAYFQQISNKSGLSLYDHLSDVIRKLLDERAPNNPVDYLEEVSMNVKRYRFGIKKEDPLQDVFFISEPLLADAKRLLNYWTTFAKIPDGSRYEGGVLPGGSFQNLLRLQYYLEMVNIGLSREEMYRVALGIKELTSTRSQIGRLRFWGKIFGTLKNYYVVEAELKFGGTDQAMDLWSPKDDDGGDGSGDGRAGNGKQLELDAVQTFSRAKDVVLNHEFLQAYSKTSGLSPDKQATLLPKGGAQSGNTSEWDGEGAGQQANPANFDDAGGDSVKWEGYQQELMQNFPLTKSVEPVQVPAEPDGSGVNRRVFYVCNELGEDWALLPPVTPQQINASRNIRWFLSGTLDNSVKSVPPFPGKEGHYLKALLVRVTAGGMCSPKGFFRSRPTDGEYAGEEDEDLEIEDEEPPRTGNDAVQPVRKFNVDIKAVANANLNLWVHHTSYILPQGRTVWWNPSGGNKRRSRTDDSEMEDDEDMEDEDEDEEEMESSGKESSPPLFQSISEDKAGDGRIAWSLSTSTSVFPESQVVCVRSNVWTGSNCICTSKGKVSNVYFGDGLKFSPNTFCPPQQVAAAKEYKIGPELDENQDPSVEEEQSWLDKLALNEISDMEAKFIDNEDGVYTGDDDDETEYEY